MANSGTTKGPDDWQNLHKAAARVLVPGVTDEEVTDLYNQWANNGYHQIHQEACSSNTYRAPTVLQQTMHDLYPINRDTTVVLDVGAGTGISGQMMKDIGFKIIDGLDPAADMLRVAQEKKTYRHIYTCYLTGDPTDIPASSYDCITMVGVLGHGGLRCAAFEEMTRIVKPGGYIVNCMRRAYLKEVPDYIQNWEPLKARMEREGRWKVIRMEPYPNHFFDNEGLLMVIQILQ